MGVLSGVLSCPRDRGTKAASRGRSCGVERICQRADTRPVALCCHLHDDGRGDEASQDEAVARRVIPDRQRLDVEALCRFMVRNTSSICQPSGVARGDIECVFNRFLICERGEKPPVNRNLRLRAGSPRTDRHRESLVTGARCRSCILPFRGARSRSRREADQKLRGAPPGVAGWSREIERAHSPAGGPGGDPRRQLAAVRERAVMPGTHQQNPHEQGALCEQREHIRLATPPRRSRAQPRRSRPGPRRASHSSQRARVADPRTSGCGGSPCVPCRALQNKLRPSRPAAPGVARRTLGPLHGDSIGVADSCRTRAPPRARSHGTYPELGRENVRPTHAGLCCVAKNAQAVAVHLVRRHGRVYAEIPRETDFSPPPDSPGPDGRHPDPARSMRNQSAPSRSAPPFSTDAGFPPNTASARVSHNPHFGTKRN